MPKDKNKKTSLDQSDTDFSGQGKPARLKLQELEKTFEKRGVVADKDPDTGTGSKRIYRRSGDLFDNTADPKAEVNRFTVRLSTRVSRAH